MREFGFELRLCAHLEAGGVPGLGDGSDLTDPGIVARQLGTSVHAAGGRIVDTVCVLPGAEFAARADLASDAIPLAAIEADVGAGRWRRVTSVFDGPPERARRLAERGADAGFLELDRQSGQTVVRQTGRYPDWVGALVGVENKPDLGRPGDLEWQARHDASLELLDYAVVATESHVTRAHLNRLPDEVGVWRVDFDGADGVTDAVEVIREPERLDSTGPGLEVLDSKPGRTDIRAVSAAAKARQRLRVAERAFGKGWRTYGLPACTEHGTATEADAENLPYCAYKDRLVDAAAECGPDCPGYEPVDGAGEDENAADSESSSNLDAERERLTAWRADAGGRRRQSGLDRFT